MKLSPRDATAYFARPDPSKAGLLIYGPDTMRTALRRQQVIAALIGPEGADEMRLTRLEPSDLRGEPASLSDAVRARGFFPGARVVFVDGATDALAKTAKIALDDWQPDDAVLVMTAGNLSKGSGLRKLFEGHSQALSAAIYADPPSRSEVDAMIAQAGLRDVSGDARAGLAALAETLDPGDFQQTVEKLALYKFGDETPTGVDDLAAIAPLTTESGVDDLVHVIAEGRRGELGPMLRRLSGQGIQPVALCIAVLRHFRTLHAAASHPDGVSEGISRLRPPLFGPRRNRMQRQAQEWGAARLEQALRMLVETDLALRSGGATAPQVAMTERALFRLCFLLGRSR